MWVMQREQCMLFVFKQKTINKASIKEDHTFPNRTTKNIYRNFPQNYDTVKCRCKVHDLKYTKAVKLVHKNKILVDTLANLEWNRKNQTNRQHHNEQLECFVEFLCVLQSALFGIGYRAPQVKRERLCEAKLL